MEYNFLGKINSPADLKKLNNTELYSLSQEIRDKIMATVSSNGGHLASNLGVVELTLAIHKVFNSPNDSIIFDVGHQCYAHKLITGRYNSFDSLRKKDGISGFMRPDESEHDPFVTGHSSNSISAACGIAIANELDGNENYTVAVIGDGALTGGMAFEGLNNALNAKDKLIIIINDNKMSISKNVGGLAKSFNRVRTSTSYHNLKSKVEKALIKIPIIGKPLRNTIYNSKLMVKTAIYHNNVFEGLGFEYLGPIDGHNIEKMSQMLELAKKNKRPTVIHALTIKGKGYKYAEAMPNSYHGVAPFDVEVGVDAISGTTFSDVFGKTLCDLASVDDKICAITAAMAEGTGLSNFSMKYPSRFFDVGISEQHAVTFAAGMASKGYKPFFAVYSSFLQRGVDQVLHDAAIAELPVTFCVDRAGLVGNDGETHQGLYDVNIFSSIPNINIYSPSTYCELEDVLKKAANRNKGVWIIRYPRGKEIPASADISVNNENYSIYNNASKTAVISYGYSFASCYAALKSKSVDLIKLNLINSIDPELKARLVSYERIVFFEETSKKGSIGESVAAELLKIGYNGKFEHISVEKEFVKQATQSQQREKYSLDEKSIIEITLGGN